MNDEVGAATRAILLAWVARYAPVLVGFALVVAVALIAPATSPSGRGALAESVAGDRGGAASAVPATTSVATPAAPNPEVVEPSAADDPPPIPSAVAPATTQMAGPTTSTMPQSAPAPPPCEPPLGLPMPCL